MTDVNSAIRNLQTTIENEKEQLKVQLQEARTEIENISIEREAERETWRAERETWRAERETAKAEIEKLSKALSIATEPPIWLNWWRSLRRFDFSLSGVYRSMRNHLSSVRLRWRRVNDSDVEGKPNSSIVGVGAGNGFLRWLRWRMVGRVPLV